MILIITDVFDQTCNAVVRALNHRGLPWVRLNGQDIPANVELSINPLSLAESYLLLRRTGARICLADISAVWLWKLSSYAFPDHLDEAEADFVVDAWRETLAALERALGEHCLFVNDIDRVRAANDKPRQLRIAKELGFEVPDTLITNSPAAARSFCERHDDVIFKLINQVPIVDRRGDDSQPGYMYATKIRQQDVAALDSLVMTPGIFQQMLPKRYDLRVTIVGDAIFAAEIHSQIHPETAVDFRRVWHAGLELPHRPHQLPAEIAARCLDLMQRLGLAYGAIDMVVTPSGDYVFLEINPNGMFGWIQQETRMPISIALADFLGGATVLRRAAS